MLILAFLKKLIIRTEVVYFVIINSHCINFLIFIGDIADLRGLVTENEEFLVERILGERPKKGTTVTEYKVKWAGFSTDESTWETEETLEYNSVFIQYQKLKKRKRPKKGNSKNKKHKT